MTSAPQVFKVQGLDCPDAVAVLKQGVGPVVGGEARLTIVILTARMTVNVGPDEVAPEAVIAAVARTGMRAEPWRDEETAGKGTAARRPTVLVVDDEAGVRRLLDEVLRRHGCNVLSAESGQAAVELFGRHAKTIDVVLLDVQMPDMDGPATLAALQRADPQVRCCFMSGHTGRYTEDGLRGMGAVHVIPKPFASIDLLAQLLWSLVPCEARPSAGG